MRSNHAKIFPDDSAFAAYSNRPLHLKWLSLHKQSKNPGVTGIHWLRGASVRFDWWKQTLWLWLTRLKVKVGKYFHLCWWVFISVFKPFSVFFFFFFFLLFILLDNHGLLINYFFVWVFSNGGRGRLGALLVDDSQEGLLRLHLARLLGCSQLRQFNQCNLLPSHELCLLIIHPFDVLKWQVNWDVPEHDAALVLT